MTKEIGQSHKRHLTIQLTQETYQEGQWVNNTGRHPAPKQAKDPGVARHSWTDSTPDYDWRVKKAIWVN